VAGNPALAALNTINATTSDGNQRYDSLQATARKRFGRGLEYQLAYTWSKGMSDSRGYYGEGGGQASAPAGTSTKCLQPQGGVGPELLRRETHLLVQRRLRTAVRARQGDGLELERASRQNRRQLAIQRRGQLRDGFPLTITALDRSGTQSNFPRADLIAYPDALGGVGPNATWFNTAAFRQPKAGTFGSEGTGVVRGPGLRNLDLSLQKIIPIRESKRLEFRAEAFNFTNTPIFNAPDVNVNSATFGQIQTAQGSAIFNWL